MIFANQKLSREVVDSLRQGGGTKHQKTYIAGKTNARIREIFSRKKKKKEQLQMDLKTVTRTNVQARKETFGVTENINCLSN